MDVLYKLVDGEVKIHSALHNNKQIKALIRRDRGGVIDGDSSGVKKYRATREVGLIWYCVNLNSPGIQKGYTGDELEEDGKLFFDIPDTWKKDETYINALNAYKEEYNNSVVVRSIKGLLNGFERSLMLVEKVNMLLQRFNDDPELDIDKLGETIKLNKDLMSISSDLPQQIKKLKELETMYLKEEKDTVKARGGDPITDSMLPENA